MSKRRSIWFGTLTACLVAVFILIRSFPVHADFNANNLMDDWLFNNSGSMTAAQIDAFLNSNFPNSCISTNHGFAAPDPTGYSPSTGYTYGGDVSAGTVIYHAAQAYGLNPQVILATMEKEENLVTGAAGCSNLRYTAAMGDACPDNVQPYNYSGFELYSLNGSAVTSVTGTCVNRANEAGFSRQVIVGTWKLMFWQQHAIGNYNWAVIKPGWDNSDDVGACYSGPMTQGYFKRCASDPSPTQFDGYYSIDGSTVHLDTGATAAFYYYTPHFHGNQLFVDIFQRWFGLTTGEGYVLATSSADNGDTRQWVVYHGFKRLVPDTAMLKAWGLDKVPLIQWSGTYLGSFQTSDPLTRLMRPTATLDVYFVDGGNCYKVVSSNMFAAWGLNPSDVRDVTVGLGRVPNNNGNLSYAVDDPGSSNVYMVDGLNGSNKLVLRQYQGPDILAAWEGDGAMPTPVSSDYFSSMNQAIGSPITTTKLTDGSQEYQAVAGQKLPESAAVAPLYPGVAASYSSATINRLATSAPVSQFVRTANSPTVYMVDSATKHAVGSPQLVQAWGVGANPLVDVVTQGNLNLLTNGSALNTFEADVSGQLYLMDGRKITVPAGLDSIYRTPSNVFSASAALMNLLPAGGTTTNFLKSFQNPAVYLVDGGTLRLIGSPADLTLWDNDGPITSVSPYVLNQFTTGSLISAYVGDGSTEYMMEGATKHIVSSQVKTNWGITNPATLKSATLASITSGVALPNALQSGGQFYRIHEGVAFMTVDVNIADAWGVSGSATMNPLLISQFLKLDMMTRFVKSKLSNDSRLFVVNNGTLYYLSLEHAANLGLTAGQPLMAVNPEGITASISPWTGVLVKDSAGVMYVIDGGGKRSFPSATVQNFWTNNGSVSVPTMTNGFLNLLPTKGIIERAIKGSGPNIYAADSSNKRWIQSWSTYINSYAPYANITDQLLSAMQNGSNIP